MFQRKTHFSADVELHLRNIMLVQITDMQGIQNLFQNKQEFLLFLRHLSYKLKNHSLTVFSIAWNQCQ